MVIIMNFDVFLYGKTRTHDYTEMYLPDWITAGSEYYSEYKKIISCLFSIREHIPEHEASVLKGTENCLIYYSGKNICLFGRHCHISGEDEFGRSIFSCEGFICRTEDQKKFWYSVPDMTAYLLDAEKTFYEEYMSGISDDQKPDQISRTENVVSYRNEHILDSVRTAGIEKQYAALDEAINKIAAPFGFVLGDHRKSLFSYPWPKELNKTEKYFVSDECSAAGDDESWIKHYRPLIYNAEIRRLIMYLEISISPQKRIRYRLAAGDEAGPDGRIADISYVSYEKESGLEISANDLLNMEETVRERLLSDGYDLNSSNDFVFEKEVIK